MTETGKKTPLNQWHRDHGGNLVDFGGWDMPLWYTSGAVKEHLTVIETAGLFDTSHMAVLLVEGAEAFDLLQYCFTKDLTACVGLAGAPLSPGRCVYGAFLNSQGHALDDAIVYCLDRTHYMVVVNANMGGVIAEHLAKADGAREARVIDLSGRVGKMDLQGPLAAKIIGKILKDPDKVLTDLPYFSFKGHFYADGPGAGIFTRDNAPLLLSRTGYTGEFGFELFVPLEFTVSIWESLVEAGREYGLIPCGLAARDSLRAGAVLPLSHQDIGHWPFINHPWLFALPFNQAGDSFTKPFLGEQVLEEASTAPHTLPFVGFDPRKVALHGPDGQPAQALDQDGRIMGAVLTCVADMALGRVDGVIYSLADPGRPEGFKARGLVCGFVKIDRPLEPGTVILLKDNRREIKVEITKDVRPLRTARRPLKEML
jgi:aminomethyltransferase